MNSKTAKWEKAVDLSALSEDEIHIWQAQLEVSNGTLESLREILCQDEIARANRFYFDKHRRRFIVARGILRILLGHHLGISPKEVKFEYGGKGKPFLKEQLYFNVSHSHEKAMYALSWNKELGIDIERIRAEVKDDQIAKRYFSALEVAAIENLPKEERKRAFFRCWTRKEAYIKAEGEGFAIPLDKFDVSIDLEESFVYIGKTPSHWKLYNIAVNEEYLAALVVQNGVEKLKFLEFSTELFKKLAF